MEILQQYRFTSTSNFTLDAGTVVNITTGQTITIACDGAAGTITALFGTGQHVIKIIRLQ